MPPQEGDAAVIDRDAADERLRRAFQSLGETSREAPADEDIQRIWRAIAGELPAEERRELVDRMASDPALAESWRAAQELSRSAGQRAPAAARREMPWWTQSWVAAAVVMFAVGAGLVLQLSPPPADHTLRDATGFRIESLVPPDAVLPRDGFRLRWTPGPEGSRYYVRVTTQDLRPVTVAADLPKPELLVEQDALSTVAPGARVLWQVDVTRPGGDTISSQTFVVRVQ